MSGERRGTTKRLGNLLRLNYGASLRADTRSGNGYPVFGSSGDVGRHRESLVEGPGIIVGRKGTVGTTFWSDGPFWPIDTAYFVVAEDGVDLRWLFWALKVTALTSLDSSTGVPGLNRNDAYELEVFCPPLPEQRRIAEILDTLDEAIRRTEEVIEKLRRMKQGLLHDLLTRGLDANGELRDPDRHPEQFKDSPLGRIPREWEVVPLGEAGRIVTGTTPPSDVAGVWGDDFPFITPAEISEDGQVNVPSRFVSPKGRAFVRTLPPAALLVVCIGSTIGKVALAHQPCATNQQINALLPFDGFDPRFLEAAVRVHLRQLLNFAGLQAVPIVNASQYSRINISKPPAFEQEWITEFLTGPIKRLAREQEVLAKLRTLKQGLMDDLLTGRVRVAAAEEAHV